MGRWTPLILMAGGIAILLGTLLGINFPLGGQQKASVYTGRRASSVLPANINVNSTATKNDQESATGDDAETTSRTESQTISGEGSTSHKRGRIAQGNSSTTDAEDNSDNTQDTSTSQSSTRSSQTARSAAEENTSSSSVSSDANTSSTDKEPIRALW
jgi:hypothetical protein